MRNYYIKRNNKKKIINLYARPQKKDHEFLPETNQEIIDFLEQQALVMSNAKKNRKEINKRIRQNTIDDMIATGDLPPDYKE